MTAGGNRIVETQKQARRLQVEIELRRLGLNSGINEGPESDRKAERKDVDGDRQMDNEPVGCIAS